MKYTNEEAFEEIMRRGKILKRHRAQKTAGLLSAAASIVMLALIIVIGRVGGAGAGMSAQSAYGSFLLSTQAGGYVLAAVLAFLAGVGATLLFTGRNAKNS